MNREKGELNASEQMDQRIQGVGAPSGQRSRRPRTQSRASEGSQPCFAGIAQVPLPHLMVSKARHRTPLCRPAALPLFRAEHDLEGPCFPGPGEDVIGLDKLIEAEVVAHEAGGIDLTGGDQAQQRWCGIGVD